MCIYMYIYIYVHIYTSGWKKKPHAGSIGGSAPSSLGVQNFTGD